MNTTMKRDGDVFVFDFEVPENTRLDYAFTITRIADGKAVEIWKGADSSGRFFTATLTAAQADEKVTVAKPSAGNTAQEPAATANAGVGALAVDLSQSGEAVKVVTRAVLPSYQVIHKADQGIHVQVRYRNPQAGQVVLVWGLKNFSEIPTRLPPGTYLTYNNSHINTPMTRSGDTFVVDFDVYKPSLFHYAFLIERSADGAPAKIWRGKDATGNYYERMLSVASADEVVDPDAGLPIGKASWNIIIGLAAAALVAFWIAFDWWRRRGEAPATTPAEPKTDDRG